MELGPIMHRMVIVLGGLLLDTVREPVTLEVSLTDSHTELLTIEPGPTRRQECHQARRRLEPENSRIYERFRRYCARVLGLRIVGGKVVGP